MSKKSKAQVAMDAEQILRYFVSRDVTNSWLHLEDHSKGLNTRFSPITLAAERVLEVAWDYAFGEGGDVRPPSIRDIVGE